MHSAAAVAVLTSDDLTNIETGLAVRDYLGERWAQRARWSCGSSTASWATPSSTISTSATCGPPRPWPPPASSAPPWGWTSSARSTSAEPGVPGRAGSPWPRAGASTDWPWWTCRPRPGSSALSRAADGGRLEHPPRRDTRFAPGRPGLRARPLRGAAPGPAGTSTRGMSARTPGDDDGPDGAPGGRLESWLSSTGARNSSQEHSVFVLRSPQVCRTFTSDRYGLVGASDASCARAGTRVERQRSASTHGGSGTSGLRRLGTHLRRTGPTGGPGAKALVAAGRRLAACRVQLLVHTGRDDGSTAGAHQLAANNSRTSRPT